MQERLGPRLLRVADDLGGPVGRRGRRGPGHGFPELRPAAGDPGGAGRCGGVLPPGCSRLPDRTDRAAPTFYRADGRDQRVPGRSRRRPARRFGAVVARRLADLVPCVCGWVGGPWRWCCGASCSPTPAHMRAFAAHRWSALSWPVCPGFSSRIRGSTSSTTDPGPERTYAGGPSARNADRTVFREQTTTRAIALIGIPSARCSRRISAQSPTFNTHFLHRGHVVCSACLWRS